MSSLAGVDRAQDRYKWDKFANTIQLYRNLFIYSLIHLWNMFVKHKQIVFII